MTAPATPPPGPALALAATKTAFRRYALKRLSMVPGGLLWMVAWSGLSLPVASAGLLFSLWGVLSLGNVVRIGWRLRRSPWCPLACRLQAVPGMIGGTRSLLVPDPERSGADVLLELVSVSRRWQRPRCVGATVWVAGEPDRGCVVAVPGGARFVWARRPSTRGERERMRRVVLKQPVTQVDLTAES